MTEADHDAIRALYRTWFSAMENADVDGFMALVTDDVILKGPGSPAIRGKEKLRAGLEAFHALYSETVAYEIEEIEVSGDLAYARIAERVTITAKAGDEEQVMEGVHLGILRRGPDGEWRVARDVSSLNSFPDAGPAGEPA